MIQIRKSMKYFVLAIFFAVLLYPQGVFAQATRTTPTPTSEKSSLQPPSVPETGINITLSPTFLALVADPGEQVSSQFRIRNNNNFTEYFRLKIAKFEPTEGGERPLITDIDKNDRFVEWISFSEDEFTLDGNENKTIRVTVSPPEDASLGYYYAVLVNRIEINETATEPGAVVAGAPAVLTLLEVRTPNAQRELQVEDFSTEKLIYEYLPTTFVIKVKNTGNIHTAPVGNIFIDQGDKKDIAVFPINEVRGNVLPDTSRTFTSEWSDGFAVRVPKEEDGREIKDSDGNIVYTTKWDFTKADKFRIGKYTANLLLVYDNGERDIPIEAQVSFWVIPWKIIGVGVVIFLLVAAGIFSIVRNLRHLHKRR